ncbi:MAG: hypothetical protein DWQ21_02960 [Bacteroidetes bacterium]|nr:MAG: hypothetical protein DWQ21_02960 [Bacteroidota bacterium]REK61342.1 MAG: hypothetical protein DWQ49_04675 [Bacteroidota bacterium]
MARISQYDQDSTLNKADKVIGTDSATGATKNYSIESILSVANEDNLVESFDGAAFEFKDYVDPAETVNGVLNLNAGSAIDTSFSTINTIYISVNDKSGNSLREYLENADNDFIKISKTDNLNQFGIYEITNIEDYGSNKYKKLTVTPRGTNGTLTVGVKYFVANYSALYDQDFSDDSVTEFQDVTSAGSGQIITSNERSQLQNLNTNALVHNDVVNNLTSTGINVPLSAKQGQVLKGLINDINTLLTSDNVDLDTLQEVVDYIETNRNTLDTLGISNISGLQAALNAKQNTEAGKGLSAEDFTSAFKSKLEGIANNAEVNVNADWAAASGDAQILNKPTDLTVLSSHNVTELSDVTSAGSGAIITGAERNKLTGIAAGAEVNVNADWNATSGDAQILNKPTLAPSDAEANVQANWNETNTSSDAFIQNKPTIPSGNQIIDWTTDQGDTNINTGNYNNTTYGLSVHDSTDDAIIRLTDSSNTTDDVKLVAGNNVTLTPNNSDVTIDIDLSTGAVSNGATTLVTGDHVFDYANPKFARKDQNETFAGNVTIQGDLTVSGTQQTVLSNDVNIGDATITLNSDLASDAAPTENAGIDINRGNASTVSIRWNEGNDNWEFTNDGSTYEVLNADHPINDLTDVNITNLANNQVLKYNSSTSKWENQAEGGSIDGTGVANKLAIWSDTDTLTNDTNLHWDSTNDRLGIGTSSPTKDLQIIKNGGATVLVSAGTAGSANIELTPNTTGSGTGKIYTTNTLDLTLGVNSSDKVTIKNDGKVGIGTSSPSEKLHVSGKVQGSSFVLDSTTAFEKYYASTIMKIPSGNYLYISNSTLPSASSLESLIAEKIALGKTSAPSSSLDIGSHTDAIIVPKGTDAQRDALTAVSGMLRFNTTDNEFEGYDGTEWGAIGGSSGGGSGEIVKKTFNGGVSAYVLDDTIADIDNVQVFVDGVYQYPSNYTVSGSTVTFVSGSTPASGTSNVHIVHNVTAPTLTEGAAMSTSVSLTGDGTTTSFSLGGTPRSSEHMMVFLNGVYQEKSTYSLSGSNVVFNSAPPNGYSIEVKYITGTLDLTDVGEIVLTELTGDGTATYALGVTPTHEKHTNVYIEGVYQEKATYSVSGSNIIFDTNVPAGYSIEVSTLKMTPASSVEPTTFEVDTFTGDGSTNNFTLVNGSPSSKSLTMVFIQGVYQAKSKYNLVSGQIQFTGGTPADDDAIEVISISAINTGVNAVTSVNGEVGEVTVQSKPDVQVISADTNAVVNTLYVFTATLTLTLPASPALGDSIKISNLSDVATCVLGRNGNKIMGDAADLTLDTASASFELIYSGTSKGWVIIGQ